MNAQERLQAAIAEFADALVEAIAYRTATIVASGKTGTVEDRQDDRRRDNVTPLRRGDISDKQLGTLQNWRNVNQVRSAVSEVVGDPTVDFASLSKRDASKIIDILFNKGSSAAGGRR